VSKGKPKTSAPRNEDKEVESVSSAAAGTTLDVEALRQIVDILEASDITRISWRRGRERLLIYRGPSVAGQPALVGTGPAVTLAPVEVAPRAAVAASAPAAAAPAAEEAPKGHAVTSPFVGTFYRTPAPDQPPFVDVGTVVRKGQVLCIIEAMKLMNEIEADVAGKITEILAQNGQPVEFGQTLFRIEPA
jgi:acetyl-CoA carboxylase biotin carboxyl carrier protein